MAPAEKQAQLVVRMPPEMKQRLQDELKAEGLDLSAGVRWILTQWLKQREPRMDVAATPPPFEDPGR